jgi:hypothetical protein
LFDRVLVGSTDVVEALISFLVLVFPIKFFQHLSQAIVAVLNNCVILVNKSEHCTLRNINFSCSELSLSSDEE